MIPRIYDNSFTSYDSNGLGLLKDIIECYVEEEANGDFELFLKYPVDSSLFKYIQRENIIKADASNTLKGQLFRIYNISKPLDGIVSVYAKHITFDLANDTLNEDVLLTNASCEYAGNRMLSKSDYSSKFTIHSNIEMLGNYNMDRKTDCLSAIFGTKGSLIDTYGNGPKILRDNFDISILTRRGIDNNVLIAYGKNLTGFELEEDISDLVTRIKPYATYTDDNQSEITVYLDEIHVDSERINDYATIKSAWMDFSDKFEDNEIPTKNKLRELAKNYFIDNNCDLPKLSYKIEFQSLSQTEEYKDYKILETVNMDDGVYIFNSKYGIRDQARVIKTKYNPITEKYISIELGDPKTTLGSIISKGPYGNEGPPGPPGPQGPKGEDGNIGDFPNSLPDIPLVTIDRQGFKTISLSWTFESKPYYTYELYASQEQGFSPNAFDLIYKGMASAFVHEVECSQTWYYKARVVNSYNNATDFSPEVSGTTTKISDAAEYFQEAAIESALIGSLNADVINSGKVSGSYIDARNLTVTDGNGKTTLSVSSAGKVNLDVASLKIGGQTIQQTLSQQDIFNTLTNNGVTQGIYLQDGKIYINGEYLKANSISASSIKVGDYTNFVTLENNAIFTGSSGGITQGFEVCNISGSEKYQDIIISNNLYGISSGDKYRVKGNIYCANNTSILQITSCWRNSNGELLSSATSSFSASTANTWISIDDIMTVPSKPSNASYFNWKIGVISTQSRRFYVEDLNITKMIAGNLMVDGAIDGKTITGATIIGAYIRGSANFMTAPNENATDGYGFRIYSTGEMYTNNNIYIESDTDAYLYLTKDGKMSASKQVQTPFLTTGDSSLIFGIKGAGASDFSRYNLIFQDREDGYSYFRPGNNGMVHLGYSGAMFNKVYSVSGIDSSSDRTVKENIQYLDTSNNPEAIQSDITEEDLYNFVRDDLITAKFNYTGQGKDYIGFIAQDVLCNADGTDNKVGQLIVNPPDEEQSPVTISDKNYIGVLAGALRKAIHKIEELEKRLNEEG